MSTGMPKDDGTKEWQHKNPDARLVHTLDEEDSDFAVGGDSNIRRAGGVKSYGKLDTKNNGMTFSVREQNGVLLERVRLTLRTLYDIIDGATIKIFGNAATNSDGTPRRTSEVRRYVVRERTSSAADTEVKVRKVRHIKSLEDFVNEINFFGRRGPAREREFQYYRFSDYVLRMSMDSFYINEVINGGGYTGVTLNEVPDRAPDEVPQDTIRELVAKSKYATLTGDQIPRIGERYSEMTGVDNEFFSDMRRYINGRGEGIAVNFDDEASRAAKATNGQRILAMTLSESIRNFRAHIINMISLDLNAHGFLSHQQYFDSHPMARADTWPPNVLPSLPRPTGFDGSYGAYQWNDVLQAGNTKGVKNTLNSRQRKKAKSARERVSDFLGTWLSNISADSVGTDHDGGKLFVEQYQGPDPTARKIDGVGGDTPLNQAIIKAVQDALVNNFRDNTEPSAAILDSPNIAGPPQASRGQIETPKLEVVGLRKAEPIDNDSRTFPSIALKGEFLAHQNTTRVQEAAYQDSTAKHEKKEIEHKVIDKSELPEERDVSVGVDEEKKLGSDDIIEHQVRN